jgi:hypothetical protein
MIWKLILILLIAAGGTFVAYRFGAFEQKNNSSINSTHLPTPIPILPGSPQTPTPNLDTTVSGQIRIIDAPKIASASQTFTISWFVQSDKIATISSTAIRYGKIPKPRVLLPSDYAEKSTIYGGTIPATFSAQLKIDAPGTYYYRAHALINSINVWSNEHSIDILSATSSATQ